MVIVYPNYNRNLLKKKKDNFLEKSTDNEKLFKRRSE